MHHELDKLETMSTNFNKQELTTQPHGFMIEVRKAFSQSKQFNKNAVLDFISNPQRNELEESVIQFLLIDA